jgi:hypothetical protein
MNLSWDPARCELSEPIARFPGGRLRSAVACRLEPGMRGGFFHFDGMQMSPVPAAAHWVRIPGPVKIVARGGSGQPLAAPERKILRAALDEMT